MLNNGKKSAKSNVDGHSAKQTIFLTAVKIKLTHIRIPKIIKEIHDILKAHRMQHPNCLSSRKQQHCASD